jgi:hypothetical protein
MIITPENCFIQKYPKEPKGEKFIICFRKDNYTTLHNKPKKLGAQLLLRDSLMKRELDASNVVITPDDTYYRTKVFFEDDEEFHSAKVNIYQAVEIYDWLVGNGSSKSSRHWGTW